MSDPTPLGIILPTPGTPARLTVNFANLQSELCNTIYLQVLPGNVGDVYFGREGMVKASGVGVIAILRPPTANHLPDLAFNIPDAMNPFRIGTYRVDVDTLNDGIRANFIQL